MKESLKKPEFFPRCRETNEKPLTEIEKPEFVSWLSRKMKTPQIQGHIPTVYECILKVMVVISSVCLGPPLIVYRAQFLGFSVRGL